MAFSTFPKTADAGMSVVEEQRYMHAAEKDRIVSGLVVSLVSGLTLRLSPGEAWVGGRLFRNDANYDFTTTANFGAGIKVDRLILRLTQATAGGLLAGVSADIQPVLITQTFPGTGGALTPLTQNLGIGVYEIVVARWVAGTSVNSQLLTNIGPGPCAQRWSGSFSLPSDGIIRGFPNFYLNVDFGASWGHLPVFSQNSEYFEVAHSGVYAIELTGTFTNGSYANSAGEWSWIRLEGDRLDLIDQFNGNGADWRAKIASTMYLPAGTTLHPTAVSQHVAAGALNLTLSMKVARVAE